MKIHSVLKTFAVVILSSLLFVSCKNNSKEEKSINKKGLDQNIGDEFRLENILDTAGNAVKLDFTKSEVTIVDFWYNECPPCIEELNQFGSVLAGKENKVSVISISLNQPWAWNESRAKHAGPFKFFEKKLPNWTHFVLKTKLDSALKNSISDDRVTELEETYNVSFVPAYFIVDKTGKILQRPESAVGYIKKL